MVSRYEDHDAGTMPAGRYWVGDLCYVLDGEDWSHIHGGDGLYELGDGRHVASFSTIHGDGAYSDQLGNEYAVDSGTLGCILASDIRKDEPWTEGGAFVTTSAAFKPMRVRPGNADGGLLRIAGVEIQLDASGNE